jgi:hypothetical protein
VSEEIANQIAQICANDDGDIPAELQNFVENHGSCRPAQLPLPLRRSA